MTAAIFGLLGVLVGGLLNLAAAVWQENRRDRMRVRPVARLVMRELSDMQSHLFATEQQGGYGLSPPTAWPSGKKTLASVVDGQTWAALDTAYSFAEYLTKWPERQVPARAAFGGPAADQYAISEAVHEAQQQLMP